MNRIYLLFAFLLVCCGAAQAEDHRSHRSYSTEHSKRFTQNQNFDRNRHHHQHHHRNHADFGDTRSYFGPVPRYVSPAPRYFPPYHPPRSPYGMILGSGGPFFMYHGPNVSIIIR